MDSPETRRLGGSPPLRFLLDYMYCYDFEAAPKLSLIDIQRFIFLKRHIFQVNEFSKGCGHNNTGKVTGAKAPTLLPSGSVRSERGRDKDGKIIALIDSKYIGSTYYSIWENINTIYI